MQPLSDQAIAPSSPLGAGARKGAVLPRTKHRAVGVDRDRHAAEKGGIVVGETIIEPPFATTRPTIASATMTPKYTVRVTVAASGLGMPGATAAAEMPFAKATVW